MLEGRRRKKKRVQPVEMTLHRTVERVKSRVRKENVVSKFSSDPCQCKKQIPK
ncbi:hypothetical protein J6590_006501 [Homalodisca vitripennis]|nr:hypothetical protein J6590_006501 [Homalodisca vitripennis]